MPDLPGRVPSESWASPHADLSTRTHVAAITRPETERMETTPVPARTSARFPRRPRLTLAIAALAALALTACGTERSGADGPHSGTADSTRAGADTAFAEMLNRVAQPCLTSASPEEPATGPARTVPSGPVQTVPPGPMETPPSDPVEPIAPTAGPEVEPNARDWCASHLHEERIAQALWDLAEPTPTKVRDILNDLGYIDERIHDLEQSGTTTRFSLDLRAQGGRLCLNGSAAGEETVVDTCVAPATGPFPSGERAQ